MATAFLANYSLWVPSSFHNFSAVSLLWKHIRVCKLKGLLKESGYLSVWEGRYNTTFPVSKDNGKAPRTWKVLEFYPDQRGRTLCIAIFGGVIYQISIIHCSFRMCTDMICLFCFSSHGAGDVLMIQPSNLPDVVEEFVSFLGLDPNRTFTLTQNDPGNQSIFPHQILL